MENLLPVLGLATVGSILGLTGGVLMLSRKDWSRVISIHAIPFAAGVMLAVSFLDILPEAVEKSTVKDVFFVVLVVMVAIFLFEQFFLHFHHHSDLHKGHEHMELSRAVPLSIAGDTIHNFLDGVSIAAAYLVSPSLGLVVALATFLHEIPQEMGDFGVMLAAGWKRSRIILVNLMTALSTYLGAVLVLLFASSFQGHLNILLAIAGGLFLYLGASVLLPEVHNDERDNPWHQAGLLLAGVIVIWLFGQLFPNA